MYSLSQSGFVERRVSEMAGFWQMDVFGQDAVKGKTLWTRMNTDSH
jgi:hypothetical protein